MAIDLQIENISKSFGDLVLFSDISFTIEERQRIGLIACNGKGKSTLLKVIAGEEPHEGGKITMRNDIRVGYLEQEPDFDGELTVIEACLRRNSEKADIIARYEAAIEGGDHSQLQHLMEEMDRLQAWDYENRAKQVLTKLKIKNFNQPIKELSGGQKKRVALAAVLIEQPDLMILDEPTNHLDLEMVEWLEEYLSRMSGSLLMVTHDRYLLDRVCTDIIEFDAIRVLRRLKENLKIDEFLDYELQSKYNSNVYEAISIFEHIHDKLKKLPPYNKIIRPDYMKLDDLINKYDEFFEDGLKDYDEEITWETSTKYGTGEITDSGYGRLRLHTFLPDDAEEIKKYDKDMVELLVKFNSAIEFFFESYISLLESYKNIFEIFMPFIDEFLHHKETYLTPTELAKAFDEYNKKHGINFTKIQCHMDSFRYKSLIDSSGNSILCEEINFEDLQSFLYFDFFNGIRNNYIPNKCKNCGKYFLIQG